MSLKKHLIKAAVHYSNNMPENLEDRQIACCIIALAGASMNPGHLTELVDLLGDFALVKNKESKDRILKIRDEQRKSKLN